MNLRFSDAGEESWHPPELAPRVATVLVVKLGSREFDDGLHFVPIASAVKPLMHSSLLLNNRNVDLFNCSYLSVWNSAMASLDFTMSCISDEGELVRLQDDGSSTPRGSSGAVTDTPISLSLMPLLSSGLFCSWFVAHYCWQRSNPRVFRPGNLSDPSGITSVK